MSENADEAGTLYETEMENETNEVGALYETGIEHETNEAVYETETDDDSTVFEPIKIFVRSYDFEIRYTESEYVVRCKVKCLLQC